MKIIYMWIGVLFLLLAGCNMATTSSQIATPYFSGSKYEYLDCQSLKTKMDELDHQIKKFNLEQDNRIKDSVGHTLFYGWGKGDGMDTIELVKIKGEKNAVSRVYESKRCIN